MYLKIFWMVLIVVLLIGGIVVASKVVPYVANYLDKKLSTKRRLK